MAQFARLEGLDQTVAALRALPSQFASRNGGPMRRALFKATKPMRDNAQARAPMDTGTLSMAIFMYRDRNPKASTGANERYIIGVRSKRQRKASKVGRKLGRVGTNFGHIDAWYWHFKEFGTEKMEKRPFLRPAFESHKGVAVTIFARELGREVEGAVRKARQAAHA